jgi:hypothetical protein
MNETLDQEALVVMENLKHNIAELKQELRDNSTLAARQIVLLELALDDARAEIERRDKLIKQMREALRWALTEARSTHCEDLIKAALEAAERGEG